MALQELISVVRELEEARKLPREEHVRLGRANRAKLQSNLDARFEEAGLMDCTTKAMIDVMDCIDEIIRREAGRKARS